MQNKEVYQTLSSDISQAYQSKRHWKLLALWCFAIVVINSILAIVESLYFFSGNAVSVSLGYLFGNVLVVPLIVLVISQCFKRFRTNRTRVKGVLYPSYLILLLKSVYIFQILAVVGIQSN